MEKSIRNLGRRAAKEHDAAMSDLPAQTWKDDIPWEHMEIDYFNIACVDQELQNTLKTSGRVPFDPMVFSSRRDGSFRVLAGHLRAATMKAIRQAETERRKKEKLSTDPADLPFAVVSGTTYEDLTAKQECLVVAHHGILGGPAKPERARMIGEFIHRFGVTLDDASTCFGIGKSTIQRLQYIYVMPTVYKEYVKEHAEGLGSPYYKVGQEALTKLYRMLRVDQIAGAGYREEGPAFRKAWLDFVENNHESP